MPKVDAHALELRVRAVSQLLASHGGGIEIVDSDQDDVVRVRFTGLCTACWMRPITQAQILDPAFRDLDGVRAVEVDGVRFSAQAQRRWLDAEPGMSPDDSERR